MVQFNPEVVSALRVRQLHRSLPKTRRNASACRELGPFSVLGRSVTTEAGSTTMTTRTTPASVSSTSNLSYLLAQGLKLAVGAQNAFNTCTDRSRLGSAGPRGLYSQCSPFSFDGDYYHLRLNWGWGAS